MEDQRYHLHCFRCEQCKVVLDGNYYVSPTGKFVCPSDYMVGGGGGGQCAAADCRVAGDAPQVPSLSASDQGKDPAGPGGSVPPRLLQVQPL